jgi:peptidyl-prolyl cis-trans isomerase A (cyclophilin A)
MSDAAPDRFRARFETSQGPFVVEVDRAAAPLGADRFHELVTAGFYDGVRFFRVLKGFVAQFGIHGDPATNARWRQKTFPDDPVKASNARGTLTFATSGPDSRTTQLFVNLANNERLDGMGFAAFGKVVEGMEVVDALHGGYGEGAPRGDGPDQGRIQTEGNAYLEKDFPLLDHVMTATIEAAE